jgi:hypothetical protein
MRLMSKAILTAALAGLTFGCVGGEVIDSGAAAGNAAGAKDDSGWIGADTFEVNAVVRGTVVTPEKGDWADLRTDADLQTQLVDLQLKFIKTTAEARGWRFNQLADDVRVVDVQEVDGGLALQYEAVVDMLGTLRGDVPALEDLQTRFEADVPLSPDGFGFSTMSACAKLDDSHSVADYNFHYYFAPQQDGCDLELTLAEIEITEVFERPISYPEYDQLMQQLEDGTIGFKAALVPNRGDKDPMSRFNVHAEMLENELGLSGTDMDGFRRYQWRQGQNLSMIIDLYDPSDLPWSGGFASHFRERLGDYTLVHYNGHSSYGSKDLLNEPEAYSDAYQIISLHSCQSYAYYSRQVFRAKATEEDPSGHALADILSTGKSSYPSGAPPTLRTLLSNLMEGLRAVESGQPHLAPDWLTISKKITGSTWGDIMYGIAGARENTWRP